MKRRLNNTVGYSFPSGGKERLLHVEAEGCIVNIRVGMHDPEGREVTVVEVIPNDYPTRNDTWGAILPMADTRDAKPGVGTCVRVVKCGDRG